MSTNQKNVLLGMMAKSDIALIFKQLNTSHQIEVQCSLLLPFDEWGENMQMILCNCANGRYWKGVFNKVNEQKCELEKRDKEFS